MRTILQRLSATVVLMLLSILTVAAQWTTVDDPAEEITVGDLKYTLNDSDHTASVSGYVDGIQAVDIPETIKSGKIEYKVTSLGDGCFYGCYGLTSVTIPKSVTSLGEECFYDCHGLTSITIPNSVTSIGADCFVECNSLRNITIPNSVTSLGDVCFAGCTSLTSITIPNSVTSLGFFCFGDCTGLTSITIPNSVTYIGSACFENCSSLATVKLPESIKCLDGAFYNCTGLKSITIPNSVTSLSTYYEDGDYRPEGCFSGCTGLTSITIPSSVTEIGEDCFGDCTSLETITVSADNKTYDSRDNCNAIIYTASDSLIAGCKNTVIPNSVTKLGNYCFDRCTSLTNITIPSSVTEIGDYCFDRCTSLTSITIPNSVTKLGNFCFSDCSGLTSITIPSSVTEIGDYCFDYRGLNQVTCLAENPPSTGDYSFYDKTLMTLYVPDASVDAYKKSNYEWKDFGNILPLSASGIKTVSKGAIGVNCNNGTLALSNVPENESVSVYSAVGQLLGAGEGNISVGAQGAQMVIVKMGGKSFKVMVK